jgi:hypothetical protein
MIADMPLPKPKNVIVTKDLETYEFASSDAAYRWLDRIYASKNGERRRDSYGMIFGPDEATTRDEKSEGIQTWRIQCQVDHSFVPKKAMLK